jgi:transcriptional regulator with XRE-family HTH domain
LTLYLDIDRQLTMQLTEIGAAVRKRREALGLSQQGLAKLAGLSRATINQLERGALKDLGVAKLARVLGLLGLALEAKRARTAPRGLWIASRAASVSYRRTLDVRSLAHALASGDIPRGLEPHLAALLDEAPLPLVVRAVEEAARRERVAPKQIWRHLARWASELRSPRRVWV